MLELEKSFRIILAEALQLSWEKPNLQGKRRTREVWVQLGKLILSTMHMVVAVKLFAGVL